MSQYEDAYERYAQPVYDLVNMWPAAVSPSPQEMRELIEGTRAGSEPVSMALVSTRLLWIYEKFASREAIQIRTDLEPEDVMQIGCLATIEAAHLIDFASPTPLKQQIINKQEREAERLVARAKLIPTVSRLSGQPIYDNFDAPFDERATDPVMLLEDAALRALVEADGNPQSSENSISKSAAYQRGLLKRALEQLTAEELIIIRGRFGYDSEWPKSLEEVARDFSTSRAEIRQKERTALKKMRQSIPSERAFIYLETTQDDLTNYGVG